MILERQSVSKSTVRATLVVSLRQEERNSKLHEF